MKFSRIQLNAETKTIKMHITNPHIKVTYIIFITNSPWANCHMQNNSQQ